MLDLEAARKSEAQCKLGSDGYNIIYFKVYIIS